CTDRRGTEKVDQPTCAKECSRCDQKKQECFTEFTTRRFDCREYQTYHWVQNWCSYSSKQHQERQIGNQTNRQKCQAEKHLPDRIQVQLVAPDQIVDEIMNLTGSSVRQYLSYLLRLIAWCPVKAVGLGFGGRYAHGLFLVVRCLRLYSCRVCARSFARH